MLRIAFAIFIGFQSGPQADEQEKPDRDAFIASASAASIAAIPHFRRMLDDKLLDYGDTRFRDVRLYEMGLQFCGYMNAKNAMGGYVGWRQFSAFHYEDTSTLLIENAAEPWITFEDCKDPLSDEDYSARFAAP